MRNYYNVFHRAQSYGVCMGGDSLVPSSILMVTRNAAGDAKTKNGKTSYIRPDGRVFMAAYQNYQVVGSRDHMHLELNHASAGDKTRLYYDPTAQVKNLKPHVRLTEKPPRPFVAFGR